MRRVACLVLLVLLSVSCQRTPSDRQPPLWKPYSRQAIKDSIAANRPVMIDFWADWCPNCHELEQTVFSLPQVRARLVKVTFLRADLTNQDDPAVQALIQQYGLEGIPTIVFLDSRGHEIQDARLLGLVTPQDFLQAFSMVKVFK